MDCATARRWLSANRDDEAPLDAEAAAHIDACATCGKWADGLARVTRQARVREATRPHPDAVIAPALAVWRPSRHAAPLAAKATLVASGVASLVIAVLGLLDVFGVVERTGFHLGWELYSFEAALGLGFLLAAWRPRRFVTGLLPVTAVVVVLMAVPAAAAPGIADAGREASHVPVMLGLVGLLLAWDLGRRDAPSRRPATEGAPA
jgi:hypothetical protein